MADGILLPCAEAMYVCYMASGKDLHSVPRLIDRRILTASDRDGKVVSAGTVNEKIPPYESLVVAEKPNCTCA